MSRRLLLIALALATLGLSACGDKERTVTNGESEAAYVTLGDMQYQVQLSRLLNPGNPGDRAMLVGLPLAERRIGRGDVWFGVWVRVFNRSSDAHVGAEDFKIVDTTGREFEAVPLAPVNVFAYRSVRVGAESEYPERDSAAGNSPTVGSLLLFRLPEESLDFRPLELEFSSPDEPGRVSTVRLDV